MCTGRFLRGQWLYCPRDMVESVSSLSLVTRMPLSITLSLELANTQHRVTESSAPPRTRPSSYTTPPPHWHVLPGQSACGLSTNHRPCALPCRKPPWCAGEAVSAQLAARGVCVALSSRHRDFTAGVVGALPNINSWLFALLFTVDCRNNEFMFGSPNFLNWKTTVPFQNI